MNNNNNINDIYNLNLNINNNLYNNTDFQDTIPKPIKVYNKLDEENKLKILQRLINLNEENKRK